MLSETFASLKQLSDAELITRVKDLVSRERGATALLIAHLAELDTRDVLLREGYASLFAYCREALGLSEHETFNRIEAARAARRFPVIVEMLAAGAVNLTAVRLLAPHLTPVNYREVLQGARGKRTEQIRELVAQLSPKPDVRTCVRKIATPLAPVPASTPIVAARSAEVPPDVVNGPAVARVSPTATPSPTPAPGPAAAALPLSPDRYRLQLTIAGDTLEKLRLAKEMLRHAIPAGDEAEIIDRALTALLIHLARKKFAATDRPRAFRGTAPRSRHIPAEVQRVVWLRDLGRCAFVSGSGQRCTERGFIEFHHLKPFEVDGEPTVENIQLRCGRHNRYEAKLYFTREQADGAEIVRELGAAYGALTLAAQANSF